jgi:hypothetical protein
VPSWPAPIFKEYIFLGILSACERPSSSSHSMCQQNHKKKGPPFLFQISSEEPFNKEKLSIFDSETTVALDNVIHKYNLHTIL